MAVIIIPVFHVIKINEDNPDVVVIAFGDADFLMGQHFEPGAVVQAG